MASMREIKSRITATKKTSQITKAMYMVSASKLKKAERAIKGFRPLMYRLRDMIDNIIEGDDLISHPMLVDREVGKICYILVSSDKGLAGPYNSSIFKAFSAHIARHHISRDEFIVAAIGFKAFSLAKRMNFELLNDFIIERHIVQNKWMSAFMHTLASRRNVFAPHRAYHHNKEQNTSDHCNQSTNSHHCHTGSLLKIIQALSAAGHLALHAITSGPSQTNNM